jgi:hypothetical protein
MCTVLLPPGVSPIAVRVIKQKKRYLDNFLGYKLKLFSKIVLLILKVLYSNCILYFPAIGSNSVLQEYAVLCELNKLFSSPCFRDVSHAVGKEEVQETKWKNMKTDDGVGIAQSV